MHALNMHVQLFKAQDLQQSLLQGTSRHARAPPLFLPHLVEDSQPQAGKRAHVVPGAQLNSNGLGCNAGLRGER